MPTQKAQTQTFKKSTHGNPEVYGQESESRSLEEESRPLMTMGSPPKSLGFWWAKYEAESEPIAFEVRGDKGLHQVGKKKPGESQWILFPTAQAYAESGDGNTHPRVSGAERLGLRLFALLAVCWHLAGALRKKPFDPEAGRGFPEKPQTEYPSDSHPARGKGIWSSRTFLSGSLVSWWEGNSLQVETPMCWFEGCVQEHWGTILGVIAEWLATCKGRTPVTRASFFTMGRTLSTEWDFSGAKWMFVHQQYHSLGS